VEGKWSPIECELEDVIYFFRENEKHYSNRLIRKFFSLIGKIEFAASQYSPSWLNKRRVSHHYDIGNELYCSFLDPKMQYSCAFFDEKISTIEEAQERKIQLTLSRLQVKEGHNVLDIGSGWGELARTISRLPNVHVTGITLSQEQLNWSRETAEKSDDLGPVHFELADYRQHLEGKSGIYDRIVSVGMFEHAGARQFRTFFNEIQRLLNSDGCALIHTIVRPVPGSTSLWMRRNIFPGGYIATTEQITKSVEESGLKVEKIFYHDGTNYIRTLNFWRDRFRQNKDQLPKYKYDEKFFRIWECYFGASINSFNPNQLGFSVAQIIVRR